MIWTYFFYHFGNMKIIFLSVLKAIKEDNPMVPTLLTDYILKVLCPT